MIHYIDDINIKALKGTVFNRTIAAKLRELAPLSPEDAPNNEKAVFVFGTYRISCQNDQRHIMRLADKFYKAKPIKGTHVKWRLLPLPTIPQVLKRNIDDCDFAEFERLLVA